MGMKVVYVYRVVYRVNLDLINLIKPNRTDVHGRLQRIRYLRISVGSVWLDELIEDILLCN